jgi:hypothetical protein
MNRLWRRGIMSKWNKIRKKLPERKIKYKQGLNFDLVK